MTNILTQVAGDEAGQSERKPRDHTARHGSASPKDEYRVFCREEASLPLFARDWWLDAAVGPDGWNVALVKKDDQVVASMPYVLRSRYRLAILTQPALTPVLGPWLRQNGGKPATQISHEKELMQALIDQLPPFDYFAQTWHSSVKNWQPFFWNGFQQTTYYTYVLPDLSDTEKLWAGFEGKMRRAINKAGSAYRLQVRDDLLLDDLLALNRKTFERQGLSPPYSDAFVRRLDAACAERGCRKFFIAVDPVGVRHAGCYIVWDEYRAYSLISGADPAHRASGGNSLCMWAAVQHAAGVTRQFNFSGSMIEPFESYLRTFGGDQVPYFHISKTRSRLLKMRQGVLSLIGKK
jgi:hypothetical protein